MRREDFEEIVEFIPEGAIAHIKTRTGDKICFKDTKKDIKQGVSATSCDTYIKIMVYSKSDQKIKESMTVIPYENISQIEYALTYNAEDAPD